MANEKLSRIVWGILVAGTWLAGGLCALFFLPYPQLKSIADHFSRHGTLASFTVERYTAMASVLPWLGILLIVAGVAAVLFFRRTLAWAAQLVQFLAVQLKAFGSDVRNFFQDLRAFRPPLWSVALVGVMTLAAVFIRLAYVNRPFGYDEAYTLEAFAIRPFSKIITDYELPNNHVLHTILVRISYLLFGPSPLAVRLPALISGVLMVPLAYSFAGRLYNRHVAILSTALVAVAPLLIDFSTNARGYTLMSMLALVIFILGLYLKDHKNRFAWLALAVVSALGFYTLPIMLYPFGILMLWLFLSALTGDRGKEYTSLWQFTGYLLAGGLATVLLTILLYAPILIYSGVKSLVGNTFVSPLTWVDFRQTLPVRMMETWHDWTVGVPGFLVILLIVGFFAGLVFHRRLSKTRFPIQIAAVLWLVITFIVQRPNPWTRIWTYLFAPLMIWASAGLVLPLEYLRRKIAGRLPVSTLVSVLAAAALLAGGIRQAIATIPFANEPHQIEWSAIFLASRVQPDDRIALDSSIDVQFWYYAHLHGIPRDTMFDVPGRIYNHVYVVVNLKEPHTAETILADRSKDGVFCSPGSIQKLTTIDQIEIYECSP